MIDTKPQEVGCNCPGKCRRHVRDPEADYEPGQKGICDECGRKAALYYTQGSLVCYKCFKRMNGIG